MSPKVQSGLRNAVAAFDAGKVDDALRLAEIVLAAAPDEPRALLLAAMSNIALRRPEPAIELLVRRGATTPGDADGYANLGVALHMAGRLPEAIDAHRQAAMHDPKNADVQANLANALRDADDFPGAEQAFRAAVQLKPGDPRLHKSLAFALRWQGRTAEAELHLSRAVALAPDVAEFRVDRGIHRLSQGSFAAGLRDLEARWAYDKSGSIARRVPQRPWKGEPLAGKSIVVWGEQGVGDLVLHGHQVRRLADDGARVVVDVDSRLVSLFKRSLPGIAVVPLSDPPAPGVCDPRIDFQVPLASLGLYLPGWPAGSFPVSRWLAPDPARRAAIAERLRVAARGRPTVGLSWRSQRAREGKPKSTDLAQWAPLLRRDALFVTLQYGDTDAEVAAVCAATGADIFTDPEIDRFNDLEGLAALIDALDVVVSTSNVTAHFAGALGKPTLLALPTLPHWYWFPAFDAYASIERFVQTTPGEWTSVIEALGRRLDERLA